MSWLTKAKPAGVTLPELLVVIVRAQTAQEKNHPQFVRCVTNTGHLPNPPGTGESAGLGIPTTSQEGWYSLSVAPTDESGTRYAASSSRADKTLECFR